VRAIAKLALLICLAATALAADQSTLNRPRDGYQKPIPVDADTTREIIAAVRIYHEVLKKGDYRKFYRECLHRVTKERQTEEAFMKQVESAAPKLMQFFSDILNAYERGLHRNDDFQIGRMPYPVVKGSLIVQFADRIDDTTAKRWPEGAPVRIEMAPDGDALKFYDID
jgi:hypothetical protein